MPSFSSCGLIITVLTALATTAAGNVYARWRNRPGALVRLPGLIMLVPGSIALRGVIEREGAAIGVFLTLTEPSRPMITEAAGAGQYTLPGTDLSVPRIQIVTIEQAMELRDRAVRVPRSRSRAGSRQ